jgi:hypothetical protein
MLKRIAGFIIIAPIISATILSGCGTAPTTASTSTNTSITLSPTASEPSISITSIAPVPTVVWPSPTSTLPPGLEPVEIVSVVGPVPPYNPGGPTVIFTLKNIGIESILYLKVTLKLAGDFEFIFFDVTPSQPLLPGQSISEKRNLIGPKSNFSSDILYSVTINGTLQNLAAFVYTKQVIIIPPAK